VISTNTTAKTNIGKTENLYHAEIDSKLTGRLLSH